MRTSTLFVCNNHFVFRFGLNGEFINLNFFRFCYMMTFVTFNRHFHIK